MNSASSNARSKTRPRREHRQNLVEVFRALQPTLCRLADYHLRGATCAEDVVTEAFFIILAGRARPRRRQSTRRWLRERVEALVLRYADRLEIP